MNVLNKANVGFVGGILVALAGFFGYTLAPEDATIIAGALASVVSGAVIILKFWKNRKNTNAAEPS